MMPLVSRAAPCDSIRTLRRLLLVCLLLGACGHRSSSDDHVLRIAANGALEPLTPQLGSSFSMVVKGLVFDLFLVPTETGWRSNVAEQWHWETPRHLELELKPGLTFSDGSPVTAADAISSLQNAKLRASEHDGWISIEADSPDGALEPSLLRAILFKRLGRDFIGTGPFSVAQADANHMLLRRRQPRPSGVSAVELKTVASHREAFAHALRGEFNLILGLDEGQLELLDGVPQLQVVRGPAVHAIAVLFNPARLSKEERRAIAQTLSTGEIAKVFRSGCTPIPHPTHGALPAGRPLEIMTAPFIAGLERAGLALQWALGPRGGSLDVLSVDEITRRDRDGEYDLALATMQVWPPSSVALHWRSGAPTNDEHYSNPELDRAIDEGRFGDVPRLLEVDPPSIPICQLERVGMVDARIHNARLGPYDMLETLPDWEYSE
jgi:hypothetical protein